MLSGAAAKQRHRAGSAPPEHDTKRHVAIKIDSMNWKMYVFGGILACIITLQPSVQVLDASTIRGLVFAAGACAVVAGLRLRRRFRCYMDRQVQAIIAQYK
jgi:hypothetical protein